MERAIGGAVMSSRNALIALVVLVLGAMLVAWWSYTFERIEQDVPGELHGEARYNPLYGLKRVLQARGVEVDSRANLNLRAMDPGENDTIVFGADVRTLSKADADALLDWVDDGGHLLFALPPSSEGRGGDLIETLHLTLLQHMICPSWPADGGSATHCFDMAFRPKAGSAKEFDVLLGEGERGYYLGRRAHGDGDWTVVADLDFLHTEPLKRGGYAQFAWQVLAPVLPSEKVQKVHLVYATDVPPLHVLLVERGWPALLPALFALLLWLWARAQRFGPLLGVAAAHRRALREHIQGAGEFTFRRGRAAALYAPVRRAFDERLRRDDPALAALEGDTLVEALAARTGHSRALVRQALYPSGLAEPEHFFVTIKTLTELRAKP
jgi:hypothetical protein